MALRAAHAAACSTRSSRYLQGRGVARGSGGRQTPDGGVVAATSRGRGGRFYGLLGIAAGSRPTDCDGVCGRADCGGCVGGCARAGGHHSEAGGFRRGLLRGLRRSRRGLRRRADCGGCVGGVVCGGVWKRGEICGRAGGWRRGRSTVLT
jgi:hypothetical protein